MTERRRVLVLDPTWELTWAEAALADVPVSVERGERAEGDDVVGLLVCPGIKVGRPELERLPRLEAVATNSTGFENLDVEALAGAGVWCSNVSGYCTQEVAEHTIALVLAQLRGIVELDRNLRTGGWYPYPVEPRRVGGSTLGVVGFGRIGRAVGERASSLGMHVLACDPMVAPEAIRAAGAEPVDLEEVLVRSDVVTLHCLVTKETRGLIDAKAIRSMRPGSVLVNCTRAALVDQDALGAALESGHLRGAAIDVFPVEPPGPDDPALGWPRTVLNAHAAWYSPEVALMPYDLAARDLAAALSGREPVYALARPRR